MSEHQPEQETERSKADTRVVATVLLFSAGLVLTAVLRFYNVHSDNPPVLSEYATFIYIGITVFAAVRLMRLEVPLRRLGFGGPLEPVRFLVLAAIGVAAIQLIGVVLDPVLERALGEGRDLGRFSDVSGSPSALAQLLILNWTVAAFGEELAFRIVLMRGIAYALGDSRKAFIIALIAQALIFGAIHAYQGPAGVIGSGINGLVFGGLTLAARGSIWPAALAHGSSNTIGILTLYLAA